MKKKIALIIKKRIGLLLGEFGFVSTADGLFYIRIQSGLAQCVIFSKTRYKDQYVITCSFDEVGDSRSIDSLLCDESRLRFCGVKTKFSISPTSQFRGTYDWDFSDEETCIKALDVIEKLLRKFAIPVFLTVNSSTKLKDISDPSYPEIIERKVISAIAEILNSKGFQLSSESSFLWRNNGEVIAIVQPSVIGLGCFLIIGINLWAPLLHGVVEMLNQPPSDFSRVSFAPISESGILNEGHNVLWFIGDEVHLNLNLTEIQRIFSNAEFENWLVKHKTFSTLLELIFPDLRVVVQRRISELRNAD